MADVQHRELQRRKRDLLHDAAEMQQRLGCEVAVILFAPNGDLVQFSTTSMSRILTAYARACREPHEIYEPSRKLPRRTDPDDRRAADRPLPEARAIPPDVAESFDRLDAMFAKLIEERDDAARPRDPPGMVGPAASDRLEEAIVGAAGISPESSARPQEARAKGEELAGFPPAEAGGGTSTPRASGSPAVGSLETPVVADLPRRAASLPNTR